MADPTGGAKATIIDPRDIVRFSVTVALDVGGEVLPPAEAIKVQATQMIKLFLNVMQTQFRHVKFQAGVRYIPDPKQPGKYVFVGDVEANLGPLKTALHDEVWISQMFDAACRHYAKQMAASVTTAEGSHKALLLPPGADAGAGASSSPETGAESCETGGAEAGAVAESHNE